MKLAILILMSMLIVTGCSPHVREPSVLEFREAGRLVDVGSTALRKGDLFEAKASFLLSYELSPNAAAVDGLGCVAMLQQDFRRAEKLFIEAYEMDRDYYHALGNLALLYEMQGEQQRALRMYKRAIKNNPTNVHFRNNFGVFLFEQEVGRQPEYRALLELQKAVALAPNARVVDNIETIEGKETK